MIEFKPAVWREIENMNIVWGIKLFGYWFLIKR